MKKINCKIVLTLAVVLLCTMSANAQLGNLLKKTKDAAKKATESTVNKSEIKPENGGTIFNPLSSILDLQFVGAYGKSTSENFGEVYLVFVANIKEPGIGKITMGGGAGRNEKSLAVDAQGNSYKIGSSGERYEVMEGVPVKLVCNAKDASFHNVKKTAESFSVVKYEIYVNAGNRDLVTLKNIPIQWDVEP